MLGDQGYKTDRDCLVVCYSEELVENNEWKAKVNKRMKTARVVIEDDIAIWKHQYPLLMGMTALSVPAASDLIMVLDALHNFILRNTREADTKLSKIQRRSPKKGSLFPEPFQLIQMKKANLQLKEEMSQQLKRFTSSLEKMPI